jgi:dCMP deaminase
MKMARNRLSWDEYFMWIAVDVAKRSTCLRRQCGAVIVKDKRIISTGYNGALTGLDHCIDTDECMREKLNIPSGEREELCKALHAEQNAIIYAEGCRESVIYTTTYPCNTCAKMIIASGITHVHYMDGYPKSLDFFSGSGVKIKRVLIDGRM